jgi:hypothetical protein
VKVSVMDGKKPSGSIIALSQLHRYLDGQDIDADVLVLLVRRRRS